MTPESARKTNRISYRVIYGDTDQMGVAYYANYLRWFEMGRTELLRQIGSPYTSIEAQGFYFPVTEVACRYHRSAYFDDAIIIETSLVSLGRASLMFGYRILRAENDLLLTTGSTRHACVDRDGNVAKIPPPLATPLKAALAELPEVDKNQKLRDGRTDPD